ncbi:MAG: type III-B CRISPR module RAMP protein Cmr4 [Candidatus Muiribacteriota bacterium]
MIKKEFMSICSLYSISPVHAGSGTSTSAVDLPIQREKHTNWPHIQASAVKGAMRSHFRNIYENEADFISQINTIFGSDEQDDWKKEDDSKPGLISVSDAKLFAFPVRSNISPFVCVTSPAVLKRLNNDLLFSGINQLNDFKKPENEKAVALKGDLSGKIILEDIVIDASESDKIEFIDKMFPEIENLILVSDQFFDHIITTCTEVQTQIKINKNTGITVDGALRYEELLPSDTAMYSVVYSENEAIDSTFKNSIKDFIQIGGDYTLGRGIFKLSWVKGGN